VLCAPGDAAYIWFMVTSPRHEGAAFVDDYIDLTGAIWKGCSFDGCILEIQEGTRPTTIENCTIVQCKLVGDGWPRNLRLRDD
jgi:hypothetical protein